MELEVVNGRNMFFENNGKAWLTIRRTKINMYTVFVYLDKGAATYGLGKRGKRRLLNEVFKKNQSLRSNLLLR